MKRSIIILGGGGHARVVIDALRSAGQRILGVIDPKPEVAESLPDGIPLLGPDLAAARPDHVLLALGVGSTDVGTKNPRPSLYESSKSAGFTFVSFQHPSAILAGNAKFGEGAQIMAGAVLQTGVRLGVNCIINTRASLDHDCQIGDHAHIAPGAVLSGGVIIGDGCHIGTGAIVIHNIRIGAGAMISAGAVITRDVLPGARVKPGPQG